MIHYALYGDMSQRVTEVLGEFSPHVEVYSIDESFVGFQGFDPDTLEARGQAMRATVRQWTGIPVCVGFAPTCVLAKVANHAAKKHPAYKQHGVCKLIAESEATKALLKQLPVTELWGVARRTGERLRVMGIVWELRGQSAMQLDDMSLPKQQIMVSRSFGRLTGNLNDLREALRQHAARAAEKLRKQSSVTSAVMVFVRTNPFRTDLPQYQQRVVVSLERPTDDSRDLPRKGNAWALRSERRTPRYTTQWNELMIVR